MQLADKLNSISIDLTDVRKVRDILKKIFIITKNAKITTYVTRTYFIQTLLFLFLLKWLPSVYIHLHQMFHQRKKYFLWNPKSLAQLEDHSNFCSEVPSDNNISIIKITKKGKRNSKTPFYIFLQLLLKSSNIYKKLLWVNEIKHMKCIMKIKISTG